MIDMLPVELQVRLIDVSPHLRFVNKQLYKLSNDIHKQKSRILLKLNNSLLNIETFNKYHSTLSFFNGVVSDFLHPEPNWHVVYSFIKNRKLFFHKSLNKFGNERFQVQPYHNVEHSHRVTERNSLKLDNVSTFRYDNEIVLSKGKYSLMVGVIGHQHATGLNTTRFKVTHKGRISNVATRETEYSIAFNELAKTDIFYPPTVMNDMLSIGKEHVIWLGDIEVEGEFELIELMMEEIGQFEKRNLEFTHLEITQLKQISINGLAFFTINNDVKCVITENVLERLNYLAIDGHVAEVDKYTDNLTLEQWNQWYTTGDRKIKMSRPIDQKEFDKKQQMRKESLRPWKVRF